MKNTLNTKLSVFLISFIADSTQYFFNEEPETLGNLIKEKNSYGINFIKRFNVSKCKFENMSKKDIENYFNWDTHTILELKKTNFIK